MARRSGDDPFAVTDNAPIRVPAGAFSSAGGGRERTGATNARLVGRPNLWNRFRATAVASRLVWATALVLALLMVLVVPAGISLFSTVRQQQIADAADQLRLPDLVYVSEESQAAIDGLLSVEAAVIMTKGLAEDPSKAEMERLITETKDLAYANDAARAHERLDEALAYFAGTYSQDFTVTVERIQLDYPYSNGTTDDRIEELIEIVRANAGGQDMPALVAAMMELPQRVGDARAEHMENYVSYVPPKPTPTDTPAPTIVGNPPEPTIGQPTNPNPNTPPTDDDDDDDGDDDDDDGGWGNNPGPTNGGGWWNNG